MDTENNKSYLDGWADLSAEEQAERIQQEYERNIAEGEKASAQARERLRQELAEKISALMKNIYNDPTGVAVSTFLAVDDLAKKLEIGKRMNGAKAGATAGAGAVFGVGRIAAFIPGVNVAFGKATAFATAIGATVGFILGPEFINNWEARVEAMRKAQKDTGHDTIEAYAADDMAHIPGAARKNSAQRSGPVLIDLSDESEPPISPE